MHAAAQEQGVFLAGEVFGPGHDLRFQGQHGGFNYALIMAATAVSTVPMLIAFIIGQRQIINSLATSGLGGR